MNATAKVPVRQSAAVFNRQPLNVFGSLQREIDQLFADFTPAVARGFTG